MDQKKSLKPARSAATKTANRKSLNKKVRLSRHAQHADAVEGTEPKEVRIAKLDAKAFHWLARGHNANIEVGRVFNELKDILDHGEWQRHFMEAFAPCGITLRTAENYMKAAREADLKIEKVSNFKSAADRGARKVRCATERAQAEVGASSGRRAKQDNISVERPALYRLPLQMSGAQMDECDKLQKLPEWPRLEEKITDLLRQLWIDYGR